MSDLEPPKPERPQNKNLIPGVGRGPQRTMTHWKPTVSASEADLERAKRIVFARAERDGLSQAQVIARIILESERSSAERPAAQPGRPVKGRGVRSA